jgi:hypothetical protein
MPPVPQAGHARISSNDRSASARTVATARSFLASRNGSIASRKSLSSLRGRGSSIVI